MTTLKTITIFTAFCLSGCMQAHKPLEFRMNGHVIKSEADDPVNSFFGNSDVLSMVVLGTGAVSSLKR